MYLDILLLQDNFLGLACSWWPLLSLISFLLGLLAGWWAWSKFKRLFDDSQKELDSMKVKYTELEKDHVSLKYQFDELGKDNTALRASINKCESDKAVLQHKLDKATVEVEDKSGDDTGIVTGTGTDTGSGDDTSGDTGIVTGTGNDSDQYATVLKPHELQIVEGIGPKIEGLLQGVGINTWSDLAAASYEDLKKALDDAGPRYRIHDPKTWPKQAELARDGKWAELIEYQKFTDGGRDDTTSGETPAKVEKIIAKRLGFSTNPEDLKVVEGIGPKIEGLLKAAGVNNWSELAACPVERLKEILTNAGDRYRLADPSTWPKQADLAANGQWRQLTEYQNFLSGGKTPS